jgi:hypothetical protein
MDQLPRGERTPTGRLLSYGLGCIACLAMTLIAWAGVYQATGMRAAGIYYIAPAGAVILGLRAYTAYREWRR